MYYHQRPKTNSNKKKETPVTAQATTVAQPTMCCIIWQYYAYHAIHDAQLL